MLNGGSSKVMENSQLNDSSIYQNKYENSGIVFPSFTNCVIPNPRN